MRYIGSRGCGASRIAGAAYNSIEVGEDGDIPIETILNCPPSLIESIHQLGLKTRGVNVLDLFGTGVYHVYDVIGVEHYPFFPDYFEEGKRYGFSRLLSAPGNHFPWELITPESRQLLIHPRAIIENVEPFYQTRLGTGPWDKGCPKKIEDHTHPKPDLPFLAQNFLPAPMCLSMLWEAMTPTREEKKSLSQRAFFRTGVNGVKFHASIPPTGVNPIWRYGIVMWLPLHVEVVEDKQDGSHESVLAALEKAGTVSYELVDDTPPPVEYPEGEEPIAVPDWPGAK